MNDEEVTWKTITESEVSRRAFLTRMGAAGLGGAAMALLAGCGGGGSKPITYPNALPTPIPSFDSVNFPGVLGRNENEVVLNFALTLEILEADLYRQALNIASGRPITTALDPTPPIYTNPLAQGNYTQTVGNGKITSTALATAGYLYLVQYAYVEAAHRDFLRVVLGSLGAPITQPNAKGYAAPFGTDLGTILGVIAIAEEEGTRAYLGAAGYMTDPTLLTNAAAIYSTECRHAAAVNYVLGADPGPSFTTEDINVVNNTSTTNPAPLGANSLQYYRTPTTVLSDVSPFFVK